MIPEHAERTTQVVVPELSQTMSRTRFIASALSTEVPPNFMTIRLIATP